MSLVDQHPQVVVTDGPLVPRHVYLISIVLAMVSWAAAALTYFVPGILLGPDVTNGNARGTALVVMALGVPVLLISIGLVWRGSTRAILTWLGSVFYLGYNSFLFLFLTPFNRLFLLYVAMLSMSIFATLGMALGCDRERLLDPMKRFPYRSMAVFVWVIVGLNALTWLAEIIPAIAGPDPLAMVEGSGVATNPIFVQDLVLWLPLMTLAAWGLWNGRSMGVLLTGSWLFFGVLESIGIAVDQWFGYQADPNTTWASPSVIPLMIALATINLVGVWFYLRAGQRIRSSEAITRSRATARP